MPASKAGAKRRAKLQKNKTKHQRWQAKQDDRDPVGPEQDKGGDIAVGHVQKRKWPFETASSE